MRGLFVSLACVLPAFAAISDKAPSIPSTYVTAHPRLPYPDNAFLDAIYKNLGGPASRYEADAKAWVPTDPAANGGLMAFRRLLITYLAYKRNNPGHANTTTYLNKLKGLANNAGLWAPRLYYVNDLSGSGTGFCTPNCTVTTTAGNFLTGCGGVSCAGNEISILAREFTISSVSGDGKTLTLTGGAYPKPNGSGMTGAVTSGAGWGNYFPGLAYPLVYDWIYSDLTTAEQDRLRAVGMDLCSQYQYGFDNNGPSPFNDNYFLSQSLGLKQTQELFVALAMHDPDNATWKATTLANLRHAMDAWFNILLPTWRLVIGNNGRCGAGTDSSTGCGGAWHEGWNDYAAGTYTRTSMNNWYLTYILAWASASGRGSAFYTTDEPWIKNFAYWTMYNVRPDFTPERMGAVAWALMQEEGTGSSTPSMGVLNGLAEMYNDPTLRGWAKLINWRTLPFDEYEPSAWPYFTPVKTSPTNTRSSLSTVRDFPGVGTIYFRTGWGESDTACYFRYAPFNFWSHPVQDAGHWACFNRGALAIRSGTYKGGEIGPNFLFYTTQAISHNTILIYDSADRYSGETYDIQTPAGSSTAVMPNDGGQRRVGSRLGVPIPNLGNENTGKQQSPASVEQWLQSYEYYKGGKLVAYNIGTSNKYIHMVADITGTYNNIFSRAAHVTNGGARQAGSANRSYRAQLVRRHLIFIPRGTSAYVVTYDQVVSSNQNFVKKNVIHFINDPTVTNWDGTRAYWNVSRAETVTARPDAGNWLAMFYSQLSNCPGGCDSSDTQYTYAGKMYGYMTLPAGGTITKIGGAGHEFDITDSAGTTNHKQCMNTGLCPTGYGLGSVEGEISSDPNSGPKEVGGYRIEQSPASASKEDWFLNVMLFTTTSETNVVSTMPSTSLSGGNYTTTWKDASNGCTYTVVLPQYGVGGTITATGAGCVATI